MRTEPWRGIEPLEARIAPAAVIELSGLDGNNGFKLSGAAAADVTGRSVSGAGDVNGDGVADFIVSAPGHSPGGLIYVIFGKATGNPAEMSLKALDGSNGFRFTAGNGAVSSIGDINADSEYRFVE